MDPNAKFRLLLDPAVNFNDVFWKTAQTWDVFVATDPASISSVFNIFDVTGGTGYSSSFGTFSMNPSGTLNWSAIPEPSSALAGLLLAAGLLRRRRNPSGQSAV